MPSYEQKSINSFTQTPSITQIMSYIIILSDTIIYYICISQNLYNYTFNIVLSTLFGVTTIVVIISGFITSYLDPSDPVVKEYYRCKKLKKSFQEKDYLYCMFCQSFCTNSAKHCRSCKRCVNDFDHHCIWINNCIGKLNYKPFMIMIISTFLHMALFIIGGVVLSAQQNFKIYLTSMIIVWIYIGILGILSFLDFNLVLLHLYLIKKGITTFQMLQIRKQQQKKQTKEEQLKRIEEQRQKQKKSKQQNSDSGLKIYPESNDNIFFNPKFLEQSSKANENSSKGENLNQIHQNSKKKLVQQQKMQDASSIGQVSNSENQSKKTQKLCNRDIRINKFFVKNKSLGVFIDQENASNPTLPLHYKKNLSLVV